MGRPDLKIFVRALGLLLKDTEGVLVCQGNNKYGVVREGNQLKVYDMNHCVEQEEGSLFWMHDNKEDALTAATLSGEEVVE